MKYKLQNEWITFIIDEQFHNKSIDEFFHYFHLSRKSIHLLKQNKEYFLNNQFVQSNTILSKKDQLKIRAFHYSGIDFIPQQKDITIVYEDDFILVLNKEAGMNVHPDQKDGIDTLCNAVAYYYQQQHLLIPVRYLHRLDYDTSGLIMFCKCPLIQPLLDDQLAHKQIRRSYLAFVQGNISNKKSHTIDTFIAKDRHHSKKMRVSNSGQRAITHYQLVKNYKNSALVKCTLNTGRTHQIRVHLSSIKHPIIGDALYGQPNSKIKRQCLHAYRLEFIHPITNEAIELECSLPKDIALSLTYYQ